MRYRRVSEEQRTLDHAISYLGAMADAGQQTITIRKAMELLGVTWREAEPSRPAPPPDADPITGCRPVTAEPS